MEEVQEFQSGTLKAAAASNRRAARFALFTSNGSGGPPGILKNARAEADKDWKDRGFPQAWECADLIAPTRWSRFHSGAENHPHLERGRRQGQISARQTWFTLLGLVVAVLALLVGWLTGVGIVKEKMG